jgi:hypothetical protein
LLELQDSVVASVLEDGRLVLVLVLRRLVLVLVPVVVALPSSP